MGAAVFPGIVEAATALRHELHRMPELGHQEHRTAARIRAELDRLGIPWQECAVTGTLGRLAAGRAGRHVALRADIDALPIVEETGVPYASQIQGLMHACGHDGHTASLLGAAAWLKRHEDALAGPVTLLFQPAEEGGFGALRMIEGGALDGVDEIFGFHSWPPIPFGRAACVDGAIMAANSVFEIEISGRGGHASQPEVCRDPVHAGAQFITAVQQIVSRRSAPQDATVVSVTTFNAGSADNIIPETARLGGTLRALSTGRREELAAQVEAVLHGICAACDCRGVFRHQPFYPATVNHPDSASRARDALQELIGPDCLWSTGLPIMGAEDFAFYLERVPGAFVLLGAGRAGKPMEPCHSPRFDFDDALIPLVVRLWARLTGAPQP